MVCLFWAVFFVIRLFRHNEEKRVTGVLVAFFSAATILYFDHWLYYSGVVKTAGEWSYGVVNLCVYPLYFAYLRALTRTHANRGELYLLFLPAVMAVFLFPIGRFGGLINDNTLFLIIRICFSIQVVWVLVRGYRLLLRTIRRMDNTYSDDRSRLLHPTRVLLVLFGITAVVSMILNFMGRDYFAQTAPVVLPAVIMTILLYGLGFVAAHTYVPQETVSEEPETAPHAPEEEANTLIHKIDTAMQEKQLYKNSGLTIIDLASSVNSNRTYVSNCINRTYGISFSQYVARFRVEEAKRILADHAYAQDKEALIDAVALSGFMSDQTFYRVFKEQTGMTPLQFRHQQK